MLTSGDIEAVDCKGSGMGRRKRGEGRRKKGGRGGGRG